MQNCADCKFATQIAEYEFECDADQYDIDNKTCFIPRGLDKADETAFTITEAFRAYDCVESSIRDCT